MSKTYTLTMSEEQAQIVVRALDLYSRIGIGQFEEILRVYDPCCTLTSMMRDEARTHINCVKLAYGHPENGSHGIHNPKVRDDFRVAYDVQQVIRNRIAFDKNPEGGFQVDFDTPRAISQLPLPTIKSEAVLEKARLELAGK
jgi:hypothetical protein